MNEWTAQLPWHTALVAAFRWSCALSALGWAWSWAVAGKRENNPSPDPLTSVATFVAVGLVLLLGLGLVSAALGRFASPSIEIAWCALVGLGWLLDRRQAMQRWPELLVTTAAWTLITATGLMLPNRSEWILGGWDPGLYLNDGVRIAREGSLFSPPDPFFAALSADELAVFTRPIHGYLEALPGVALSPEHRALDIAFFRLTPTWIALLYRCGGLPLALRIGWVAAWTAAFIWAGAFRRVLRNNSAWGWAAVVLVSHSLFIYHSGLPLSEVPGLALLGTLVLFDAGPRSVLSGWFTAATLWLSVANRFSFLPFGALWLYLSAMADTAARPRRSVHRTRFLHVLALAGGAWFDWWTNLVTLQRLGDATGRLAIAFAAFAAAAVVWDLSASIAPSMMQRAVAAMGAAVRRAAHPVVTSLFLALILTALHRFEPGPGWNARVAIFLGPLHLAVATLGWTSFARQEFRVEEPIWRWAVLGAAGMLVAWVRPEITLWWPWASRRFLEFALPWVALGSAVCVARLTAWIESAAAGDRRLARRCALAIVGILCLVQLPRSLRAWRSVDFPGATARLAPMLAPRTDRTVLVVDHFRWATPLKFLAGHSVVNGELFLSGDDRSDRFRLALHTLQRLVNEGWTVRFLTTTRKGVEVFPSPVSGLQEDRDSGEFELVEVVHHLRARGFSTRARTFRLRRFTWQPSTADESAGISNEPRS